MERTELMAVAEATGCAMQRGGFVFLCDPKWGVHERKQFKRIEDIAEKSPKLDQGWLCLSTGGTSGRLRFARHDEHTFTAAVRGFCEHFGMKRVNAVDVLPPFHVSGFMSRVRCAVTGGTHIPWIWKELESEIYPELPEKKGSWVLSLVPTQLQRLLSAGELALLWLHQFKIIFVGGGPTWPALANGAARAKLPVVFSYGMTETAAMVTAQKPDECAAGRRNSGCTLPHARVEIVNPETGAPVPSPETGVVRIGGESLFRGYVTDELPLIPSGEYLQTEDIGYWDAHGGLNILGRRDAVIITGGKKVFPAEVEAILRTSGVFADVAVIGVPDDEWGQSVVACYPSQNGHSLDMTRVQSALHDIAKYKWPRRYVPVVNWPRNGQGKLSRPQLISLATGIAKS